jgi:hypothetical protein
MEAGHVIGMHDDQIMQWNKKGSLGLVEDGVLVDKLFTEDSG